MRRAGARCARRRWPFFGVNELVTTTAVNWLAVTGSTLDVEQAHAGSPIALFAQIELRRASRRSHPWSSSLKHPNLTDTQTLRHALQHPRPIDPLQQLSNSKTLPPAWWWVELVTFRISAHERDLGLVSSPNSCRNPIDQPNLTQPARLAGPSNMWGDGISRSARVGPENPGSLSVMTAGRCHPSTPLQC